MSGRHGHPRTDVALIITRAQLRLLVTAADERLKAAVGLRERNKWAGLKRKLWRELDAARAETAAKIERRRSLTVGLSVREVSE